jgi:hypothetical protein
MRIDAGLPDRQRPNVRGRLSCKPVYSWRVTVPTKNGYGVVDQAAMLQFIEDIEEITAGETPKQKPAVISVRD